MRDHTKAFCVIASESLDCPGPVYEFGSYQVEGQVEYADLRRLFPNTPYIGCDMRPGLGVDRVEDVTALTLPDSCAGTVLCIETFEHVFEVWKAFDEVYRILQPGGAFVITSPFYFKVHGYPDDYWRMTPSCLRRMMSRFEARLCGWQGPNKTPHTVMAIGVKTPAPADIVTRLQDFRHRFQAWLHQAESTLPLGAKVKRSVSQLYRSKGERQQLQLYYHSDFHLDVGSGAQLCVEGPRHDGRLVGAGS